VTGQVELNKIVETEIENLPSARPLMSDDNANKAATQKDNKSSVPLTAEEEEMLQLEKK
jgi:hypothetical protein